MSSGRHSIGPLRFQAWSPEWAFHPDAAESALMEQQQRHHDFHLDHHLDRLRRAQPHRLELPAMPVRWRHWRRAQHLHVDLEPQRPQGRPGQRVLQPDRNL
jgi:hypothetical protein